MCFVLFWLFSPLLRLLSPFAFWDPSYTHAKYCSTSHWGSIHFVSMFLILFRLDNVYGSVFKFTYIFFLHLQPAIKSPSRDLLIAYTVLFSSRISIWSFITFSISLLTFPIYSFLVVIFSFKSLDIFIIAALMFLSANANIWVISEIVCLD